MRTYGRNEATNALSAIAGGTASLESKAELEHHLLGLLRGSGTSGGVPDTEVEGLDPRRRAVFYVGLLEAEVMNGGFGQYLSNTDGVHLGATLGCLHEIGAHRTASLLDQAAQLGAGAESYATAWEANASTLERLDGEFMASGEDLAGLAADTFLKQGGENDAA